MFSSACDFSLLPQLCQNGGLSVFSSIGETVGWVGKDRKAIKASLVYLHQKPALILFSCSRSGKQDSALLASSSVTKF
jgi:hypothetical protein